MLIIGLTEEWCEKCKNAKKMLSKWDITWVDASTQNGREIVSEFNVVMVPFFVIENDNGYRFSTPSVLTIKKFLESKENNSLVNLNVNE